MGLSATYCGFCYNEFFSLPINLFDSCYEIDTNPPLWNATNTASSNYFPRKSIDCNYPVGVDPVWGLTTNRLTFVNNIKMKLSVIFGVLHMTMGVVIKGTNSVYFGRWEDFIFEVCTGLIILEGLFGWMDLLIFAKWFFPLNFSDRTVDKTVVPWMLVGDQVNQKAPSVINILINSVFGGGAVPGNKVGDVIDPSKTQYAYVGAGQYWNVSTLNVSVPNYDK